MMQNRGIAFSLDPAARNALQPGRRPFHTLNPPLAVFDDGRVMSYGSMGGDGQPQFQAQVFTRIAAGETLADAVAAPRHLWGRTWGEASVTVKLEAGYDDATAGALARAGHEIEWREPKDRDLFGHAGALLRPEGRDRGDPRSALRRRAGRIVSFGLSRSLPRKARWLCGAPAVGNPVSQESASSLDTYRMYVGPTQLILATSCSIHAV